MSGREIKKIVDELSYHIGIKRRLFVRIVSFRSKVASVSFVNGTLRLNRDFVRLSNTSLLRYIIIHELIHIKLGHHYHNDEFYREIKKYLDHDIARYDKQVLDLMMKINN